MIFGGNGKEKKIFAQKEKNCDFFLKKMRRKEKKFKVAHKSFFGFPKKVKVFVSKENELFLISFFEFLIIFFSNFRLGPSVLAFYKS